MNQFEEILELRKQLADALQREQQREFDVMTFCSIVGVEAEEELEPKLRDLVASFEATIKKLQFENEELKGRIANALL